jgi:hypothetical protein
MPHLHVMLFNNKKYILILFTLCIALLDSETAYAQKYKKLIEIADNAMSEKDFFTAAQYYNQAILKDSSDIALQYKYAEASRENYDNDIALYWYTKVHKQDAQGVLFPECIFWMASLKKAKGNYKDAKTLFNKYVQKNKKNKNSFYVRKAMQEAASCDQAQWLVNHPDTAISIIHLDTSVNSTVSEYAPFQKDNVLYFSTLRDSSDRDIDQSSNYNKIYTSIQQGDTWDKAIELDSLFNKTHTHNANTAFHPNQTKIYITRCEEKNSKEYNCKIYSSELKNKVWGPFEKLPETINIEGTSNTHPAIGYLGTQEVLFFASNRPGGEGGMDIWYSKIRANKTYEKPINAGKKINTIEDEITPFYCIPCQELFFSSTWHKGLGGFDIFKSYYKDNDFLEPSNLGIPINSSYNDIYFSISSSQTKAFLSSNRKGSYFEEKESCCNDIYMFKIPNTEEPKTDTVEKVKQVIDSSAIFIAQLKQLIPVTLYFHNDEPDKKTLAISTLKNYKTTYEEYAAMKDIYKKEFSKALKPNDIIPAQKDIDILFEDSISTGMRNLEEFSKILLKAIEKGDKINITIKGYCSPLASTQYNTNLAKRRISSLKNYFVEYNNGVFTPYINNTNSNEGSIVFIEEQIGELKSKPEVSDNYYDVANSIYNPNAALERKIQIIAISTDSGNK